jgi:DNA repair protein RadC
MFLMSSQVKKFSQRELRDKKHEHFSTVSLPTDSVIVDHAVYFFPLVKSIWGHPVECF